jgi:hypothetical protein
MELGVPSDSFPPYAGRVHQIIFGSKKSSHLITSLGKRRVKFPPKKSEALAAHPLEIVL